MEQSNRMYTDEFIAAFSQRDPIANVSYSQTEGSFQWSTAASEAQQHLLNQQNISERQRQLYQGLTYQRVEETMRELFYGRREELDRQRRVRIWPESNLAQYPMTPQEAIPWDRTRFSNEPFSSESGTIHDAVQEHVRQYIEGENNYILRVQDPGLLEEMTTYSRQYDRVMANIMAYSETEFKASLQKETNKASPYLDFDNY